MSDSAFARPEADHRQGLFTTLLDRFSELGGIDLAVPARAPSPRAAELSE